MKRAVFEYTKMILPKVSFDPNLLYKKPQEGVDGLLSYEVEELKAWFEAYTKNRPELLKSRVLVDKWCKLRLPTSR